MLGVCLCDSTFSSQYISKNNCGVIHHHFFYIGFNIIIRSLHEKWAMSCDFK